MAELITRRGVVSIAPSPATPLTTVSGVLNRVIDVLTSSHTITLTAHELAVERYLLGTMGVLAILIVYYSVRISYLSSSVRSGGSGSGKKKLS